MLTRMYDMRDDELKPFWDRKQISLHMSAYAYFLDTVVGTSEM